MDDINKQINEIEHEIEETQNIEDDQNGEKDK